MNVLGIISLFDGATETDIVSLTPHPEHEALGPNDMLLLLNLRKGDTVIQVRGTVEQVRHALYEPLHVFFAEREMRDKANVPPPQGALPC